MAKDPKNSRQADFLRGYVPPTCEDVPERHGHRGLQDAKPATERETSRNYRYRGSQPVGGED